jgi:hypothetical protein
LSALRDASSARVLNLVTIEKAHKDNPEYKKAPLFESPVLNSSIIVKHRLRADEVFLFDDPPLNATKIIIPFDKNDLRLGGTSLLYGQRGCMEGLREAGKYGEKSLARDIRCAGPSQRASVARSISASREDRIQRPDSIGLLF